MNITGTHINYHQVCRRKLWLFGAGILMEHTSDLVAEGKVLHDTTYLQRSERYSEFSIEGIKIDYYDATNRIVHEVKKSNKIEDAHVWQVKYYLYVLQEHGITDATAVIEYPTLRHTVDVRLTEEDCTTIRKMKAEITSIINSDHCPPRIDSKICKNCSYYEFCYSGEEEKP
ncbi:CRISPR-associated protein Cas4 [Porphyromonas sp.]|uniref:CRISPR-associated protein Cas4 n=1 Tax=Porphyromonas sp. TaxID=1924944 RepID=UPI0026DB2697|nr:CRISPR-associated protein Cas4 [Porphyromonas sp.]MDO4695396.1 CRISPR-associated protein Cas4 [Porphyromonas sp.]MDO4770477.1 CRISPR-associated protein Cas4 [Porphyromonas sp.]